MKFSLLHPSRQRPHKSYSATKKWLDYAASRDFELIVSIDENDPLKDEYIQLYNNHHGFNVHLIVRQNKSAVDAINNAAKEASGEIFIVVSDDTDTIDRWDQVISKAVEGRKDFVLKVADGIQNWIVTMPVMDKDYYNRFGYVYHPDFAHMFCDTCLTHTADALGRVIWRNDIRFEHLHYSVRKSQKDNVSIKADATFEEGKRVYLDMVRRNLLLDPSVNIWNLSPDAVGHLKWLKQCV